MTVKSAQIKRYPVRILCFGLNILKPVCVAY